MSVTKEIGLTLPNLTVPITTDRAIANIVDAGLLDVNWRIRCQGCTFGRTFGTGETSMRIVAASHALRKGHKLNVFRNDRKVEEIDHTRDTDQLGDIPPY